MGQMSSTGGSSLVGMETIASCTPCPRTPKVVTLSPFQPSQGARLAGSSDRGSHLRRGKPGTGCQESLESLETGVKIAEDGRMCGVVDGRGGRGAIQVQASG